MRGCNFRSPPGTFNCAYKHLFLFLEFLCTLYVHEIIIKRLDLFLYTIKGDTNFFYQFVFIFYTFFFYV